MDYLKLTKDILNIKEISDIVSSENCGAVSLFVGTTRDSFEGKRVISLEYEAYEKMALKQMELICKELRCKWPDIVNIAIYHRLGLVEVKESSVVIAISSPHRKSSLDAVAFAIEEIKKRVPIWKKEIYKDGSIWKENKEFGIECDKNSLISNMCDIEESYSPSKLLVQISVSEDEINRRIQCFVEKKRDEIDMCNVMDFNEDYIHDEVNAAKTHVNTQEDGENSKNKIKSMTCARVNCTVIKQEFSKGHLKVRRVNNNIGPQMRPDYLNTLDKLMVPLNTMNKTKTQFSGHIKEHQNHPNKEGQNRLKYSAILERLNNIEEHTLIPKSKIKNIYQRLKDVEDRILYIESISPEYRHFLIEKSLNKDPSSETINDNISTTGVLSYERKIYSLGEIESIIQSFEGHDLDQIIKILDKKQ